MKSIMVNGTSKLNVNMLETTTYCISDAITINLISTLGLDNYSPFDDP